MLESICTKALEIVGDGSPGKVKSIGVGGSTAEAAAVSCKATSNEPILALATRQVHNSQVVVAISESSDVDNPHQILQTNCIDFQTILFSNGTSRSDQLLSVAIILEAVPGFRCKYINLRTNKISLSYEPDVPGPTTFLTVIESTETGYFQAVILAEGKQGREFHQKEETEHFRLFLFSLIHVILLFVTSMVFMFVAEVKKGLDKCIFNLLTLGAIIRLVVATVMQIITIYQLYSAPRKTFISFITDMDVLIALKANIIWFCSVYSVVRTAIYSDFQGMDFFGTSLNFMAFCLLGRYLDGFVKQKRSLVISKSKGLAMEIAMLLNIDRQGNGTRKEFDSGLIQRTDLMRIILGSTTVGKWKQRRANDNGVWHYKRRIIGLENIVSQIAGFLESDQMAEGPAKKSASSFSRVIMFLGISVSLIAWLGFYLAGVLSDHPESWLPHSMTVAQVAAQVWISVLAISSSCSFPLSIQITLLVATLVGAKQGILFQSARALERKDKVNCIVFNKRTLAKPEVVGTKLLKHMKSEEFLQLVASVEANSRHPLAKAITEYAWKHTENKKNLIQPEAHDFVSIAGRGVKAIIRNKDVLVGNKSMMVEHNVAMPEDAELDSMLAGNERTTQSMIFVSIDSELIGVLKIRDQLKPGAFEVISTLKSMKVKSFIVTGDSVGTAMSIASKVGVGVLTAEANSAKKVDKVKKLQDQGYVVAMVDADTSNCPSLIAADVGITIGAGKGIASEVADVVITSNNLEDIVTAIDVSNKTISRNHWNSIYAIFHNLIGILVAIFAPFIFGSPLQPWIAGTIAASSSLVLAISSFSLKFYRKPKQLKKLEMKQLELEILEMV